MVTLAVSHSVKRQRYTTMDPGLRRDDDAEGSRLFLPRPDLQRDGHSQNHFRFNRHPKLGCTFAERLASQPSSRRRPGSIATQAVSHSIKRRRYTTMDPGARRDDDREDSRNSLPQSFLTTMLGNLLVISFAFSATFTATLRAICL